MTIIKVSRATRRWGGIAGVWFLGFCLAACQTRSSEFTPVTGGTPAEKKGTVPGGSKPLNREVLQPGDSLSIIFADIPTHVDPFEQIIKDDGTVTLSYNEKFVAAGKSPGALEKEIRERYVPRIYQYLTVTVRAGSRVYYVGGEVKNPNRWPYIGPITVMKAIQSAGDFTDFARKKKVQVFRSDGRIEIVDCKKAIKVPSLDLEVYPGDKIIVPRRYWPWQ
jgi:protein involved in polysaccharide export with SLBB domain